MFGVLHHLIYLVGVFVSLFCFAVFVVLWMGSRDKHVPGKSSAVKLHPLPWEVALSYLSIYFGCSLYSEVLVG